MQSRMVRNQGGKKMNKKEMKDDIIFFLKGVLAGAIILGFFTLVFSHSDDHYDPNSLPLKNGAYVLKSDPMLYISERYNPGEKMISVMLVLLEKPEGKPIEYATSNFLKIPEGLKKGDVVVKSDNGLRKAEIEK